jgi:glycosyltransferase involved in cell wall biosynthesis
VSAPKVSIIIPVYNVEKYIQRCINSLTSQTLEEIEIILVDDSSTDSSLLLCQKAAEEDSRIKVITKANEGAGKARNAALGLATGKYIGFVDSDDYVNEDMFKTLYEKAEEYNSDLVMSGVLFVNGNMFSQEGDCVIKTYFDADTHFESEEELNLLKKYGLDIVEYNGKPYKYGTAWIYREIPAEDLNAIKNLFN